ncbi:MAG: metal-dependent phosphohydrolase [Actinomycetota bacterium]|nr:metal-dependent phosphohydrolase [Actinomycetota bacterium]
MAVHEVELRDAWRHLSGGGHTDALERLLGRYREPHRRYHTAEHVMWVLRHVAEIAATGAAGDVPHDLAAVQLAALYHDAVYNPAATQPAANEIASASLAGACAAAFGWSDERADRIERLVLATAHDTAHSDGTHAEQPDADTAVLVDADLAILGAEPAAYAAYVNGVRHEYHHVPDHLWRQGRATVLQSLLDRRTIYATPHMRAGVEARARANLAAELATLSHS